MGARTEERKKLSDMALHIIREHGAIRTKDLMEALGVNHSTMLQLLATLTTTATIWESDDGYVGFLNDNRAPYGEGGFLALNKTGWYRDRVDDFFCRGSVGSTLGTKWSGLLARGGK